MFYSIRVFFLVITTFSIAFIDISIIPMSYGDNVVYCNESIHFLLGCVDLALHVDEPHILTESSNAQKKINYELWERSNRLSLMLLKSCINKSIRGFILQCSQAKDFLKTVDEQFIHSN
jgi:hypothetical protein